LYLVDNGIKWRALPADFPPWSTVYHCFACWEPAGVSQDLLDYLRERVRLVEGRAVEPSVHPTCQHTNPQPVIEGPEFAVARVHAKVRREGYHRSERRR
jgi:transposase